MKPLIFGAIALVLLFGCIGSQQQQEKEDIAKELEGMKTAPTQPGLIGVSGNDNLSVVTIRAENAGGRWQFPLSDYEDEFVIAGLYSDSFVKLNRSQIAWLDEGEDIWLTAYTGNGSGVLFNAIYSNGAVNCSSGKARILGREYALSALENGSSFLFDDKWKVAIEGDAACPRRIVVYLDGYFDGLGESDQVSLFRNDNAILLQFESLNSEPIVRVIAAKPP